MTFAIDLIRSSKPLSTSSTIPKISVTVTLNTSLTISGISPAPLVHLLPGAFAARASVDAEPTGSVSSARFAIAPRGISPK